MIEKVVDRFLEVVNEKYRDYKIYVNDNNDFIAEKEGMKINLSLYFKILIKRKFFLNFF